MKNYNPSITERANRLFNLKSGDSMSDEVDGPVAVIPLTPAVKVRRASGSNTIWPAADKDLYITAATLSIAKTAAESGSVAVINATIDGISTTILEIRGITLTADLQTVSVSLPYPLKVDKNTAVALVVTGAMTGASAIVYGYHEEVTRT
jgi:hypothetical protein